MVNTQKLKGKILEKRFTQESVAEAIGIDKSTFYRKMKLGGTSFTIKEVNAIVRTLKLSKEEVEEIFLISKSQ